MITKNLLKLALLGSSWVMYLLLGLSVISFAAMFERWWFFRKHDEDVEEMGDKLNHLLEEDKYEAAEKLVSESKSIEAMILARALRWTHGGPESFARAVEAEIQRKRKDVERGMNILGTLGNNAPFVGLFGTVIGVIEAFAHLGDGQDKNAMAQVMSGIAEALVATGVGLFVAIPAVIAYNFLQKKVTEIEDNVGSIANQIGALLEAKRTTDVQTIEVEPNVATHAPPEHAPEAVVARASARTVEPAS